MKKPTEKITHTALCHNVAKLEKRIISQYRLDVMLVKMENLKTTHNYIYQRIFSLENQVSVLNKAALNRPQGLKTTLRSVFTLIIKHFRDFYNRRFYLWMIIGNKSN
jgi:hypothetical protein